MLHKDIMRIFVLNLNKTIMTKEEFAFSINGTQKEQIDSIPFGIAKSNGLFVAYGWSDDLLEIDGLTQDEFDVWNGGTRTLKYEGKKTKIKAKRFPRSHKSNIPWVIEPEIPFSPFNINDEDGIYCMGAVFSINDLI